MNEKLLELAARRGALGVRIAGQREALARHARGLSPLFAGGDAALRGIDWLKLHPGAVFAAVAAAVVLRPRRVWRWAARGVFVWRGWQKLRSLLH